MEANSQQHVRNRSMVTGGVVAGVGTLITMAGVLVAGLSALAATRDWVNNLDQSPAETARTRMTQARAAATAGWDAWQKQDALRPRGS